MVLGWFFFFFFGTYCISGFLQSVGFFSVIFHDSLNVFNGNGEDRGSISVDENT